MPANSILSFNLSNFLGGTFFIKAFLLLFLVFYIIFALMLFRQIQLMTKTLPTPLSPLVRFIAIVHLGFSLALLFVTIGAF